MRSRLSTLLAVVALLLAAFSWVVPSPIAAAGPALKSIGASGSVTGGANISIKVTLTSAAPTGGTVVSINSNRPSIIPVPKTVTVPKGATTITVGGITTKGSRTSVFVSLSAKLGGVSQSTDVLVRAPYVTGMSGKKSIASGSTNVVNFRINAPAGVGGMPITLTNTRPNLVTFTNPTPKVLEGQTVLVVDYTVRNVSGSTTFGITAEAADKGIANVPLESRVKPLTFNTTINAAEATVTATKTATKAATKTPTNTVPAPTQTASSTATTAPATATSTVVSGTATATGVPMSSGCAGYNNPAYDVTASMVSASGYLDAGDMLRVTTSSGATFTIYMTIINGFSTSTGTTYEHTMATNGSTGFYADAGEVVTWDVSCTSAAPGTATATRTFTPTATATSVALSDSCLNSFNHPQYDFTSTEFNASGFFQPGDVVRLTTTSGASFAISVAVSNDNYVAQGNFTEFTYVVTGGYKWHGFGAEAASDVTWQLSCGDGTSWPATATPAAINTTTVAPSLTPTQTITPSVVATNTATIATTASPTPTASVVGYSEACQAVIDGYYDTIWPGVHWGSASLYAGETVTFSAGGTPFNLDIYALSLSVSGITTYTWVVPTTGTYDMQFVTSNSGDATWDLTCE